MKPHKRVKTTAEVRAELKAQGKPINAWAMERGYQASLVYEILKGAVKCNFGQDL